MTVPAAVHYQSSPTASDSLLQFTSQLATGSTTPPPNGITPLLLPYNGKWLWDSSVGSGSFVASDCHSTNVQHGIQGSHAALISASEAAVIKSRSTSLPVICATPDSGATASLTPLCSRLKDIKPCDEIFGSAEGQIARATHIGSMPVIARASNGSLVRFAFTNVRCVPRFKYTLLSVKQLWKEQNIDARFRDLDHLEFPASSGGITIPYDSTLTLSTLVLVSDTDTISSSTRSAANSTPSSAAQHALLGFHAIKSTSHIARMSAAQA